MIRKLIKQVLARLLALSGFLYMKKAQAMPLKKELWCLTLAKRGLKYSSEEFSTIDFCQLKLPLTFDKYIAIPTILYT